MHLAMHAIFLLNIGMHSQNIPYFSELSSLNHLFFSSSCPPIHASYSIVYDFEDEYDDMDDVLSSDCDDTASDCSEDDDSN